MPRTPQVLDATDATQTDNRPAAGRRTSAQTSSDLAFLARAMKAPALLDAADRLAERARESWTQAKYLVACLQRKVTARESHGGEARVRAARFPAVKTIGVLDVSHPPARPDAPTAISSGHVGLHHGPGEHSYSGTAEHGQDAPGHLPGSAGRQASTASRSPQPLSGSTSSPPHTRSRRRAHPARVAASRKPCTLLIEGSSATTCEAR